MWQSQATTDSGTHTCLVQLIFSLLMTLLPSFVRENTIRDGGSTALYSANTVYTFYTVQTALHCLNSSLSLIVHLSSLDFAWKPSESLLLSSHTFVFLSCCLFVIVSFCHCVFIVIRLLSPFYCLSYLLSFHLAIFLSFCIFVLVHLISSLVHFSSS